MNFLKHYASIIESGLQELTFPETPKTLYDPQRYILKNGGKRIRPIITLMGCGLCGGNIKKALPAALAVEMVHNFTLIHDDIMDKADSRRGLDTVHVKWNESSAILSGDGIFVQALLLLQNLPDSVNHKKIMSVFLEGINTVCEGQALDMEFEKRQDVTTREYLNMISGKTGALMSASLQMGGLVAGAGTSELNALKTFGESVGIAFQIQDDWLDVVADPDTFGKKRAGDIYKGKKTFLMLNTLERCNNEEKKWLTECLEKRPLEKNEVDLILELYHTYGVIELTKNKMNEYYQKAEKALNLFGDSNYKQDLLNLITYLKNREN